MHKVTQTLWHKSETSCQCKVQIIAAAKWQLRQVTSEPFASKVSSKTTWADQLRSPSPVVRCPPPPRRSRDGERERLIVAVVTGLTTATVRVG